MIEDLKAIGKARSVKKYTAPWWNPLLKAPFPPGPNSGTARGQTAGCQRHTGAGSIPTHGTGRFH